MNTENRENWDTTMMFAIHQIKQVKMLSYVNCIVPGF